MQSSHPTKHYTGVLSFPYADDLYYLEMLWSQSSHPTKHYTAILTFPYRRPLLPYTLKMLWSQPAPTPQKTLHRNSDFSLRATFIAEHLKDAMESILPHHKTLHHNSDFSPWMTFIAEHLQDAMESILHPTKHYTAIRTLPHG